MKNYLLLFSLMTTLSYLAPINANAALFTCPAVHPNYPNEPGNRGKFDGAWFHPSQEPGQPVHLNCLYKNVGPTVESFPNAKPAEGKWQGYLCEAWTNRDPLPQPIDCPIEVESSPIHKKAK